MLKIHVSFGLKNTGRGLARFPYLSIESKGPFTFDDIAMGQAEGIGFRTLRSSDGKRAQFLGDSSFVVYPDCELMISAVSRRVNALETRPGDFRIDYEIRAQDMKAEVGNVIIPEGEMIKKMSEI